MRRNWRAAAAVLGVIGLAAVLLPATVGAQKVLNPGNFVLAATGGEIRVGTTGALPVLNLTPQPLAQCVDGIDNDGDGRIDSADSQCVPGPNGEPDDSEVIDPNTGRADKNRSSPEKILEQARKLLHPYRMDIQDDHVDWWTIYVGAC